MTHIILNGQLKTLDAPVYVSELLRELGLDPNAVAVERNLQIVTRSTYDQVRLIEGDKVEIVHFIGGGSKIVADQKNQNEGQSDFLVIAGRSYHSRLLIGTGKYKTFDETARAIEASGAEIVTVAVRRVNITNRGSPTLVDYVDPKKYVYLPNTAGCFSADEAVRTLRLAREAGGWNLVKLEVLGDQKTLFPNMTETLAAAQTLVSDGFQVMVYCSDDPILAKKLEDLGCVAIMPLAAPIGSGLGIQNPVNIRLIVEQARVPVLVDAGVGTASDAAVAMELGCDGVLMNTAIAEAKRPIQMAYAMQLAVRAGRAAYLAGRMSKRLYADPSSPLAGIV